MAKKPQAQDYELDPRKRTTPPPASQLEPGDNADLDEGRIISSGVGISEGELRALDSMATQIGVSRNALMRLAVRLFIKGVRARQINPDDYFIEPEKPRKRATFGKQARR